MKKWVFLNSDTEHRKNVSKRMVLMKKSYQEDPIAIIFIMVARPEEAYEIGFYEKCSKRRKCVIVPVPDRGILKSSRALLEAI